MESNLNQYLDILREYGITPTFPITARTLSKHPSIIENFLKQGVEFAIHGFRHIDHTKISQDAFYQQIDYAIKIFQKYDIQFSGFRFPYLRWDRKCFEAIDNSQLFRWDSSRPILWEVIDNGAFSRKRLMGYQHMLRQYNYRIASTCISLPRYYNKILEIPVSLPDDDLLIDRLGIKDQKLLSEIWGEILKQTYLRGELLTLQLHPERIPFYGNTLNSLIQTANHLNPKIWLASLGAIAEWWKEKQNFSLHIDKKGNTEFEIYANCSDRATILIKNGKAFVDQSLNRFYHDYNIIDKNTFKVQAPKLPIICISKTSPPTLIKFLKNEGFIFQTDSNESSYSLSLNDIERFDDDDEMKILQRIHRTYFPLIRFWRWPNRCRSALSITGDIDALISTDFFSRLYGS